MMSIRRVTCCILILMAGWPPVLVGADFAQDKKECQDKLVGLSSCVGFISGEERNPSSTCCLKLVENFNQSRRCMCILVRDRNEPSLGFKVNATLALTLPLLCHIGVETHCLEILKLDPRSPEAQIFQQFANSTAKGTTTTHGGDASSGTCMRQSKMFQFQMVGGISLWLFVSSFFSTL